MEEQSINILSVENSRSVAHEGRDHPHPVVRHVLLCNSKERLKRSSGSWGQTREIKTKKKDRMYTAVFKGLQVVFIICVYVHMSACVYKGVCVCVCRYLCIWTCPDQRGVQCESVSPAPRYLHCTPSGQYKNIITHHTHYIRIMSRV